MVAALLEKPTRTPRARVQGLIYLAAVLGRYGRYGDCIAVYDYLLGLEVLDEETTYGLRLGRAMSMQLPDDKAVTPRLFPLEMKNKDLGQPPHFRPD